jgi:hypothetical protein
MNDHHSFTVPAFDEDIVAVYLKYKLTTFTTPVLQWCFPLLSRLCAVFHKLVYAKPYLYIYYINLDTTFDFPSGK